MIDFADPSDRLLLQLKPTELERARLSVFRSLHQAHKRRDLLRVETLALQLSAMARYMRRREAGQVLVEFALLLPVMVLMGMAFLNLCIGVSDRQQLQAAAAEAARWGTIATDPRVSLDAVQAEAIARAAGLILGRDPEASAVATGFSQGDLLTVTISARQEWLFFPAGTMRAVSSARYQ